MPIKVAAIPYPFSPLPAIAGFEKKIWGYLNAACSQGAKLVVFPEYIIMELVSLYSADAKDVKQHLVCIQQNFSDYLEIFSKLAKEFDAYICGGSFPLALEDGSYRNRSFLFGPSGKVDYQDKIFMTRFENEIWGISPGNEIKVFETAIGNLAINICYDSEFATPAAIQARNQANILIVPSCTDSEAGYTRVKIGCAARALENQFIVIQSSTIGTADWCETIDTNVGAAGIYCPPDHGFPSNGVIAQSTIEEPKMVLAEIDLNLVNRVRENGQVLNFKDSQRTKQVENFRVISSKLD